MNLCEEELDSGSSDGTVKIKHEVLLIDTFSVPDKEEYPSVAKKALTILIELSYWCELGFPSYKH